MSPTPVSPTKNSLVKMETREEVGDGGKEIARKEIEPTGVGVEKDVAVKLEVNGGDQEVVKGKEGEQEENGKQVIEEEQEMNEEEDEVPAARLVKLEEFEVPEDKEVTTEDEQDDESESEEVISNLEEGSMVVVEGMVENEEEDEDNEEEVLMPHIVSVKSVTPVKQEVKKEVEEKEVKKEQEAVSPMKEVINLVEADEEAGNSGDDVQFLYEEVCQASNKVKKEETGKKRKLSHSSSESESEESLEEAEPEPVDDEANEPEVIRQIDRPVIDLCMSSDEEMGEEEEVVPLNQNGNQEDKDEDECLQLDVSEEEELLGGDSEEEIGSPTKKRKVTETSPCDDSFSEEIEEQAPSTRFDSPESFSSFQSDASSLLVSAEIKTASNTDLDHFWNCAGKMLSVHGHHLKTLTLDFDGQNHTETQIYKMVRQALVQTPNLSTLAIKYHGSDNFTGRLFTVTESLPSLKQLTTLNLEHAMLPPLMNYVLIEKFGATLQKLGISIKSWNKEMVQYLPVLNALSISQVNSDTALELHELLESVQKNQQLRNQLKKLALSLEVTLLAGEIFVMLKPFKGLQELKLVLRDALQRGAASRVQDDVQNLDREDYINEHTPELTSVKRLTLSLSGSQRTFRFLLRLPNLEQLELEEVSQSHYGLVAGEKVAKIDTALRRLLATNSAEKSKIWELLPSVKVISVKWVKGLGRDNSKFRREDCV